MSDQYFRETIFQLLSDLPKQKLNALKKLFWVELNYNRENETLSTRDWSEELQNLLTSTPLLFASGGTENAFHILYINLASSKLLLGAERQLIHKLHNQHPHSLFVFSNQEETYWHFVNVKSDTSNNRNIFRRITVSTEDRLRTATERLAMLDLEQLSTDIFGISPLAIQSRHDEAFDVERITKNFFKEYQQVFTQLQNHLLAQNNDQVWAHDYALQFLNRVMFLFFVQRKHWMNGDTNFLANFWKTYKDQNDRNRSFVNDWLNILFFEAFNKKFGHQSYLPQEVQTILQMAPYLNGGLFTKNELDEQNSIEIADDEFNHILAFFEKFNFTISEDTPLDQEVAVDPEMIGKVYESLVNVTDNIDEQSEAGIFYTPRVEIDLMVRLTLVDWLCNHFGTNNRNLFIDLLFSFEEVDKRHTDQAITNQNLWPSLHESLQNLTLLDPACGSGSFLVGALYVINDLIHRAERVLGLHQSAFDRKKTIIGSSLYGVDVKEWAVRVAELRLWLQLVIESDLRIEELQLDPLLPNLSFKLRCGDSIVQKIGGVNLSLRHGGVLSPQMKGKITEFKGEKRKFYNNEPDRKYPTAKLLHQAELLLFREWLEDRSSIVQKLITEKEIALRPAKNLFGETKPTQLNTNNAAQQIDLDQLQLEQAQLKQAKKLIVKEQVPPFVWDIAFVEVFEGETKGFDIVIGNPPYVRQEEIRNPKLPSEDVTPTNKRDYKADLANAIYSKWPQTFGNPVKWTLDAKSDLYIYFYFYCLGLLNQKGSFCFITSNSWLDVGYGVDLQQFVLTRGEIRLILDNEIKRSFTNAEVNTVIVLLNKPTDQKKSNNKANDFTARFVMAQVPYESLLNQEIWKEIFNISKRTKTTQFRVMPRDQGEILSNGLDKDNQYQSDKWGGKYLRAPDIYWHILEKYGEKLIRLGDIADVRRGITTGGNDFFYLSQEMIDRWKIEEEFLLPSYKSPKEINSAWISNPQNSQYKIFMCHEPKEKLKNKNSLRYIEFGESQKYHRRPTCKSRTNWYDLGQRSGAKINCNYLVNKTMVFFAAETPFLVSDNFQEIHLPHSNNINEVFVATNCSFTQLSANILGRANFGGGLMKIQTYEVDNLLIPDLTGISALVGKTNWNSKLELDSDDRKTIDQMVKDYIGFSSGESDDILDSLNKSIENRLQRADSQKSSQAQKKLSNLEW